MSWPTPNHQIGSVGLYVDDESPSKAAVVGTLHPLDATEDTIHHSGSNSRRLTIVGTLVTSGSGSGLGTEYETLEGYSESDTARSYVSDQGTIGNFIVLKVDGKRKNAVNYAYPIYRVTVELVAA